MYMYIYIHIHTHAHAHAQVVNWGPGIYTCCIHVYIGDACPSASQLISCNCPWYLSSSGYPMIIHTHSIAGNLAIKILGIANTRTHTPQPHPWHTSLSISFLTCVLLYFLSWAISAPSPFLLLSCSSARCRLSFSSYSSTCQLPQTSNALREKRERERGDRERRERDTEREKEWVNERGERKIRSEREEGRERVRKSTGCPIWVYKHTFSLCLFLSSIRWTLSVHLHSL